MRFVFLAAVLLKVQVFWDVTLCHWANISPTFRKYCCLYLQRKAV